MPLKGKGVSTGSWQGTSIAKSQLSCSGKIALSTTFGFFRVEVDFNFLSLNFEKMTLMVTNSTQGQNELSNSIVLKGRYSIKIKWM